jgi:hypothetical protein
MRKSGVAVLSFVALLCSASVKAQENACANPGAPRVVIVNLTPSKNFQGDLAARYEPVDRFAGTLGRAFAGACVVTDASILDDTKAYPSLNGSMLLLIQSDPSLKQERFVAVSIEFSVLRGMRVFDRMPVTTYAVLLEPDDTQSDLDRKARASIDRYDRLVQSLPKKSDPLK